MRAAYLITLLLAATAAQPLLASSVSREDAMARVQSAGYSLVSKTDAAPGVWDVWASKDGIAYRVKVNARDGTLIAAIPVEVDD